jgi:hypothetical protein
VLYGAATALFCCAVCGAFCAGFGSARAIQQVDATTLEATGVLKGEGDAPMANGSRRESPRLHLHIVTESAPESPAEEILLDVRGNSFGRWQEKGAIVSHIANEVQDKDVILTDAPVWGGVFSCAPCRPSNDEAVVVMVK